MKRIQLIQLLGLSLSLSAITTGSLINRKHSYVVRCRPELSSREVLHEEEARAEGLHEENATTNKERLQRLKVHTEEHSDYEKFAELRSFQ